jgi:eukaryotic-like serine/threonine-protein kinase
MDETQWNRISEIFDNAIELPVHKREAFVLLESWGNPFIVAEVLAMLGADRQLECDPSASDFLKPLDLPDDALEPFLPSQPPFQPGQVVRGRFRIIRSVGEGGMGHVFEAWDDELEIRVALKAIRPEISNHAESLSRFRREVRVGLQTNHPNICRTFQIDHEIRPSDDGSGTSVRIYFFTMEFLEGETLATRLAITGTPIPGEEALALARQIAAALDCAHDLGVVHRDVKPANVMLVTPATTSRTPALAGPPPSRAVVTDFGLAHLDPILSKANVSFLSRSGFAPGTLYYMAPEQLEGGTISPATDIYAFGLLLFEMVTGERAYRAVGARPLPRQLNPNLPQQWEDVIERCLAFEPAARFQRATDAVDALDRISSPQPSLQTPDSKAVIHGDPTSKHIWQVLSRKTAAFSMCLVLIVTLFIVAFRYYNKKINPDMTPGGTVLLTEIKNNTGDPRFDAMTEILREQLSQSAVFRLMGKTEVRDVLERMTKSSSSSFDPTTAREIALRTGASRVIFGAVSRIGDSFTLDLEIEQPDSEPSAARAQWSNHWNWRDTNSSNPSVPELPSGLLDAIRDSATWTRHELGESPNDIARLDAPPQDVTTNNWDALSQYALAEKFDLRHERESAVVALQNSVAADPHFALAYLRMGDILVSIRQYDQGYNAYLLALREENLRRLTRRERDRLRGIFTLDTGDFAASLSAFRDYSVYYPNDYLAWFYQAYPLMMMGRVEESLTVLQKAQDIDPTAYSTPSHIARFNLILGRFKEAQNAIDRLRQMGHSDDADDIQGGVYFLQGHYDRAEELYGKLRQSNENYYRTRSYMLLACLAAELGRYQEALNYLDIGITSDIASGDAVDHADKLLAKGYLHLKLHDYPKTLEDEKGALALDRSLQRSAEAADLIGIAEQEVQTPLRPTLIAELYSIQEQLSKSRFFPISEIVHARVHGDLLLAQGHVQEALKEFKTAARLDAPATRRDYLARGLLAAAAKEDNITVATKERESALEAYGQMALRPGQIWQLPEEYPPGFFSDQLLCYAKLASQIGKLDQRTKAELENFLKRREPTDVGLPEVNQVRELLRQKPH